MAKAWSIYCIYDIKLYGTLVQFSAVGSVMSKSLWPHGPQHVRPPCPSPSPRVYSNSCPSSRWCPPAISFSILLFSSCLQSFPVSESFTNESVFCIRWLKYWSLSFSISPSNASLVKNLNFLFLEFPIRELAKDLEAFIYIPSVRERAFCSLAISSHYLQNMLARVHLGLQDHRFCCISGLWKVLGLLLRLGAEDFNSRPFRPLSPCLMVSLCLLDLYQKLQDALTLGSFYLRPCQGPWNQE